MVPDMENVESHSFVRLNKTNDTRNFPKKYTSLQPCRRENRFRMSIIRAFPAVRCVLRCPTIHTFLNTLIFEQNGFVTRMIGSSTETELYPYRRFYGVFRNPLIIAHRLPYPTLSILTENTEFRQFSDGQRHVLNTRIVRTQCDPNIIIST